MSHEAPRGDGTDYSREAVLARWLFERGLPPPDSPRMRLEGEIDRWARQFFTPEDYFEDDEIRPAVRLAPGSDPVLADIGIAGSAKLEIDTIEPSTSKDAAAICCFLAGPDGMAINPDFAKKRLEEVGVTTGPGAFLILTGGKDAAPALVPLELVNAGRTEEDRVTPHQYLNESRRNPDMYPVHMLTDEECTAIIEYLRTTHKGYVDYDGDGAIDEGFETPEGDV